MRDSPVVRLSTHNQLIMVGAAVAIAAAVMVVVWIAVQLGPHSRYIYTQDAVQIGDLGLVAGSLTRAFVMLWSAAVGIALFVGTLARSLPQGRALLAVAAFTALIVADDHLLFHEFASERFGEVLPFDKPPILQAVYALLALALAVRFREGLRSTPWLLLAAAVGFLGASALLDAASDVGVVSGLGYLEAGAKYAGIVASVLYLVLAARALVAPRPAAARSSRSAL